MKILFLSFTCEDIAISGILYLSVSQYLLLVRFAHSWEILPPLEDKIRIPARSRNILNIWVTKCEVKMAGYWPSFFCVFMDRNEVKVHKHAKKERGKYPAILTEQAG